MTFTTKNRKGAYITHDLALPDLSTIERTGDVQLQTDGVPNTSRWGTDAGFIDQPDANSVEVTVAATGERDLELSLRLYDSDTEEEVHISVAGNVIARLPVQSIPANNGVLDDFLTSITIPEEYLAFGENVILIEKQNVSNTWGVTDISVIEASLQPGEPEPVADPLMTFVKEINRSVGLVRLDVGLDAPAQLELLYGAVSGNLDQTAGLEESYEYQIHKPTLRNLAEIGITDAGGTIYIQGRIREEGGEFILSEEQEFIVSEYVAAPPVSGGGGVNAGGDGGDWPAPVAGLTDADPHGGTRLGMDVNGSVKIGNEPIANHVGMSFVARCSIPVDAFVMEARRIADGDLNRNYEPWLTLKAQGWPRDLAGFYISNPYSKGNFTAAVEFRRALPDGLPDMSIAGLIAVIDPNLKRSFTSANNNSEVFYPLSSEVTMVPGVRYCALAINQSPLSSPNLRFTTKAQAAAFAAANPEAGATSINGSYLGPLQKLYQNGTSYHPSGQDDTSSGFADNNVYAIVSNNGTSWSKVGRWDRHTPMMAMRHTDGKVRGALFTDYTKVKYDINSNSRVRYRFTTLKDYTVNGLELGYAHHNAQTILASHSISAQLKQGNNVLKNYSFPANLEVATVNAIERVGTLRVDWSTRPDLAYHLDKPAGNVLIQAGVEYTIELSANGHFKIPIQHSRMHNNADDFQGTFVAEYKNGNGAWTPFSNGSGQTGHWLFTLDGGPDRFPNR